MFEKFSERVFERYNARARRAIYFARYEAGQCGAAYIEPEHLLLALCRDDRRILSRMLGSHGASQKVEEKLRQLLPPRRSKVSTSADLPLSNECKQVLSYAAEESGLLADRTIGAEHLVLGLLREKDCRAERALTECGLTLAHGRAMAEMEESEAAMHDLRVAHEPIKAFLELVDHSSGERLEVWPLRPLVPVPRMGEMVVLRKSQQPPRAFRVVSVVYEFNGTKIQAVRLCLEPLAEDQGKNDNTKA